MKNRTGKPVRKQDFFDREQELDELWYLVERDNVLMLAPRRSGKTSLLLHMVDNPRSGWVGQYVDVEGVASEAQFVARLLSHVYRLKPDGAVWARLGDGIKGILSRVGTANAGPFEVKLGKAIGKDWQEVGSTMLRLLGKVDGKTLLLIDELPIFVRRLLASEDGLPRTRLFLDWFRALRISPEQEEADAHFLMAGSVGLDAVVTQVDMSGTINDLETFRLGPLSPARADELLEELGRGESLELPETVRERILERITWPIPYHLQLMFREVLREVRYRQAELAPELVDGAFDALLDTGRRKYFAHWEERLRDPLSPQPERDLMTALLEAAARDPNGISYDTAAQLRSEAAPDGNEEAVLLGLERDGYLVLHDRRWRFASALVRAWWLKWKVRQ